MTYTGWTKQEKNLLKQKLEEGFTYKKIQDEYFPARSLAAIASKAWALGKNKKRLNKKNKVGYKNPPIATRFQKGQSGNPKGRPVEKDNLAITQATLKSLGYKLVLVEIA